MTPDRNPATSLSVHGDPGLQPERTTLAWVRTLLGLVTLAMVALRCATHYDYLVLGTASAAVLTAAAILLTQRRRYVRSIQGIVAEKVMADYRAVLATAAVVVALGLSVIVSVVAGY
ncbi:DUF202 domain-containing protein [Rhodococcus sp. IEGM 248]|nr:DUF202 domain-containing protein [Rhodococcus sp. IEGM 248]